jgi:hypothetical protein
VSTRRSGLDTLLICGGVHRCAPVAMVGGDDSAGQITATVDMGSVGLEDKVVDVSPRIPEQDGAVRSALQSPMQRAFTSRLLGAWI